MKKSITAALLLFLITTADAADSNSESSREWSDNTGTFKVSAAFVEFDSDAKTVRLKLDSGKTVDLPIRRLSPADRNYVNAKATPPAGASKRLASKTIAGVDWIQTREDASRAAFGGESVKDDKPIMCFRALGDLSGFM